MAKGRDRRAQWIMITLMLPRLNSADGDGAEKRRKILKLLENWMAEHHHPVRLPAPTHSVHGDCIAVSFQPNEADRALMLRILAGRLGLTSEMKQFRVTETYSDRTTHPNERPEM